MRTAADIKSNSPHLTGKKGSGHELLGVPTDQTELQQGPPQGRLGAETVDARRRWEAETLQLCEWVKYSDCSGVGFNGLEDDVPQ